MISIKQHTLATLTGSILLAMSTQIWAHGDVTPQPVDASKLEQLGEGWREINPYTGNADAIAIGESAYTQNCARCHGLGAVSGGIAPDLRELPSDEEGDEYFVQRVRNGAIRNGVTYMPKFEGVISQEGLWSIRAWLESIALDELRKVKAEEKPTAATTSEAATTEKKTEPKAAAVVKPASTTTAALDGKALYTQKLCMTCHGDEGKAPLLPNYPKLNGQTKEYLVAQIKLIKDGIRTSGQSPVMVAMVANLTDSEIDAISDYLSKLN